MKNSWKTTATGIVLIAGIIVVSFWPEHTLIVAKITGVLTGLGFIIARDNDVSSEDAGANE